MNIIINENLKNLRKRNNKTQEDLAEYLTVSITAVSKWERGECYPDIEFLPKIASYYNVSIDDLLGFGEIKRQERIQEYLAKYNEICVNDSYKEKSITLWREAQKEFPNDYTVLYHLMYSLWWKYDDDESYNEMITIGERLLTENTDPITRFNTIRFLGCSCYLRRDDFENAKKYADMLPNHWNCKEDLYSRFLKGEEGIQHNQSAISSYTESICQFAERTLISLNETNEKIKILEFILNLLKLVYNDGDFDNEFRVFITLYNLTCFHLEIGNKDKAMKYFIEMPEHFIKFYTNNNGFKHTSFMVNRLDSQCYRMPNSHMTDEVSNIIQTQFENNKVFDSIRNEEYYSNVIEKMKTLLKN